MSNPCIFCGKKSKKCKEHLWPVWMHQYLTFEGDGENICEAETHKWTEKIDSKSVKRQGKLSTKKIRVVCGKCNSGWMSNLENQAKPTLVRIFKEEKFVMGRTEQENLSRWIATKVIVGEHAEKNIEVTPKKDRESLMSDKKIPEYFAIYIGKHSHEHDTAWLRTSMVLALSPEGPNPDLKGLQRNAQTVAFICGPLFVFVFSVREKDIDPTTFFNIKRLIRLLPVEMDTISWPPSELLTDEDMSRYAWALNNCKNDKNVYYAGDLP